MYNAVKQPQRSCHPAAHRHHVLLLMDLLHLAHDVSYVQLAGFQNKLIGFPEEHSLICLIP